MADPITIAEEEALKTGEEMDMGAESPTTSEFAEPRNTKFESTTDLSTANRETTVIQPIKKPEMTLEEWQRKNNEAMRAKAYGGTPKVRGQVTATSEVLGQIVNSADKNAIKKAKIEHTAEQHRKGYS